MMGKTYYCGERMCSSDMMPQKIVKINGNRLPQKELFQKMNNAFDGKIGVLQVTWHNGIKWLCTKGWPDGGIWWKMDNKGRTFTMTNKNGWQEIFGHGTTIYTPKDTVKELKVSMERRAKRGFG